MSVYTVHFQLKVSLVTVNFCFLKVLSVYAETIHVVTSIKLWPFRKNFTKIVPGEPLHRGS